MKNWQDHINVELLELYVLGISTPEEAVLVEQWASQYPEVQQEIDELSKGLELIAKAEATPAPPIAKPFLMASINYVERLKSGEKPSFPPLLTSESTLGNYVEWLEGSDSHLPPNVGNMHIRLIGATPKMTTAIVWIKEELYPEEHSDQLERFLIVEGACDMYVGDTMQQLKAGDVFTIPLHTNHYAKVTSSIPCKIIVQRIAA
ncbi:MAG: cupin domain-containing protein [Aureispira sp.]|nr:cupin domain-containing protein [Aureispira sp.]